MVVSYCYMKLSLLTLALFVGYISYSQNDRHTFQAGIEAGFGFTTIHPYQVATGFFDNITNGTTTNPRVGIFVNRFISDYHQLEFGIYYTEKGTAWGRPHKLFSILYAGDNKTISINYFEIPLSLNYYPYRRRSFCYTYTLGYLMLVNETRDLYNMLYKDSDIEASMGIRFKLDRFEWMNKFLLSVKFGFSVIPISNSQQVESKGDVWFSEGFKNARNYDLTFSIQRYL